VGHDALCRPQLETEVREEVFGHVQGRQRREAILADMFYILVLKHSEVLRVRAGDRLESNRLLGGLFCLSRTVWHGVLLCDEEGPVGNGRFEEVEQRLVEWVHRLGESLIHLGGLPTAAELVVPGE